MNKIKFLLCICLVSLFSCHKTDTIPANNQPDVYLAGFEFLPGGTNAIATYWKDGVAVHLTDGSQWALKEYKHILLR